MSIPAVQSEHCPICIDDLYSKEVTQTLCGHEFHEICLDSWLKTLQNPTCPMCCQNPHTIPKINALCCAILGSEDAEIDKLLDDPDVLSNIDMDARGGKTLLAVAIAEGNLRVIKALCERKAKLDPLSFIKGMNLSNFELTFILLDRINASLPEESRISLSELFDLKGFNLFDDPSNEIKSINQALEKLVCLEDLQGLNNALKLVMRLGVKVEDLDGMLLHLAIERENSPAASLLLSFGFNPDARDEEGESALHKCMVLPSTLENIALMGTIFSLGLDVDAKESVDGLTALHMAAIVGNVEWMDELLIKGANINAVSDEGMTALDYSIEKRREFKTTRTFREAIYDLFHSSDYDRRVDWLISKGAIAIVERA